MFLPIITYADGYGFTYGGRVSTVGSARLRRTAFGTAHVGRHAPRGAGVRAALQERSADANRVELRHLEPRKPALRDPRSARRAERTRRKGIRRRHSPRRRWLSRDGQLRAISTTASRLSARTSRSTHEATRRFRATRSSVRGLDGDELPLPADRINRYTTDARGYLRCIASRSSPRARNTSRQTRRCRRTNGCCSAAPPP